MTNALVSHSVPDRPGGFGWHHENQHCIQPAVSVDRLAADWFQRDGELGAVGVREVKK